MTMSGPWELRYEIACPPDAIICVVELAVDDADGNELKSWSITGSASGSYYFPKGGTYLLEADTVVGAHWKIWPATWE
jgi:hypothetical protein